MQESSHNDWHETCMTDRRCKIRAKSLSDEKRHHAVCCVNPGNTFRTRANDRHCESRQLEDRNSGKVRAVLWIMFGMFQPTKDTFQDASTSMTTLAVALECAMLMDDAAQARYAAIYGEVWQPLSDIQADMVADYASYEVWSMEAAANTATAWSI